MTQNELLNPDKKFECIYLSFATRKHLCQPRNISDDDQTIFDSCVTQGRDGRYNIEGRRRLLKYISIFTWISFRPAGISRVSVFFNAVRRRTLSPSPLGSWWRGREWGPASRSKKQSICATCLFGRTDWPWSACPTTSTRPAWPTP